MAVYQDTFLISGIMCFGGCGYTIREEITDYINKNYGQQVNKIKIFPQPMRFGRQALSVTVVCDNGYINRRQLRADLIALVETLVSGKFRVHDPDKDMLADFGIWNWVNVTLNILAIVTIVVLSVIFPPSLPLNIALASICFATTLFTARQYIFNFVRRLNSMAMSIMEASVAVGWSLELAHAIYHIVMMPSMGGMAMVFMNFLMPLVLVTVVNVMDLIRQEINKSASKLELRGIKSVFPEMQDEYYAFKVSEEVDEQINQYLKNPDLEQPAILGHLSAVVNEKEVCALLDEKMLILVGENECFPVDGTIVSDSAYIDSAIVSGEPAKHVAKGAEVYSGSLNLGKPVYILASKDPYDSKANQILFESNTQVQAETEVSNWFYALYIGIFVAGFTIALGISLSLGIMSCGGILQIVAGSLFAICPCTVAIGHFLPALLQEQRIHSKGIIINNSRQNLRIKDIDAFVFDKTGTLTDKSAVFHVEGEMRHDDKDLLPLIARLEQLFGRGHPIAKAILEYKPCDETINAEAYDIANGIAAKIDGLNIIIGQQNFMQNHAIACADEIAEDGSILNCCTQVHVACNGVYKGVIYIKHDMRPGMKEAILALRGSDNKPIYMLTGDNEDAAKAFNRSNDELFSAENIVAGQTPTQKGTYLEELSKGKKVCFIGDGLNDAIGAKKLFHARGISVAISTDDKAAFFTDFALNGNLDYLTGMHDPLMQQRQKIEWQNKFLLAAGALLFLVFFTTFPAMGIGLSPLIPMAVMFTTTLFVVFNSYRLALLTDDIMEPETRSLSSKFLQSDYALACLLGGAFSLVSAVLIASLSSLHFVLPTLAFHGDISTILSSCFLVVAVALLAVFAIGCISFIAERFTAPSPVGDEKLPLQPDPQTFRIR